MKTHGQFTATGRHQHFIGLLALGMLSVLLPQARAVEDNAVAAGAGANAFASATALTNTFSISATTNVQSYTAEAGEPGHQAGGTNGSLHTAWWKFTAPSSAWCTVDTLRSAKLNTGITDTLLAVYRGSTLATLTQVIANNNALPQVPSAPLLSRLTFYAEKDITYYIAVDAVASYTIDANNRDIVLSLRHHELISSTRDTSFCLLSNDENITLGHITVTNTATGRLSGKLATHYRTWSFTGVYAADGYFETQLESPAIAGVPQPPIRLRLDNIGEGGLSIEHATQFHFPIVSDVMPRRRIYQGDAPGKGTHTSALLSGSGSTGYGYTLMQVKPTGAVTMAGISVDGTPYTMASHLHPVQVSGSTQFQISGMVSMHKKKGGLLTLGRMESTGDFELVSRGVYVRPAAPTATFYPAGIGNIVEWRGARYTAPAAGNSPLGFLGVSGGPGTFIIGEAAGEMVGPDFTLPLTYTPPKFIFTSSTNKPKLTLNAKTGLVTGSVVDNGGVTRKIKAILTDATGSPQILGQASGKTRALIFVVN